MAANNPSATLKKLVELANASKTDRLKFAVEVYRYVGDRKGKAADLARRLRTPPRRLHYFAKLGGFLKLTKLPAARCVSIGWTKLSLLAEHFDRDPQNVSKLTPLKAVEYSEQCTVEQLREVLNGEPLPPKGERTHRSVFLRLTQREYKIFESVLLANRATKSGNGRGRGLVNKEAALMRVIKQANPK